MSKTNRTKKKYFSPFTACAVVAIVVLSAFVLNGYISLNELTISNSKKKNELEALNSENAVLSMEIDRKNSLDNIEQIATEQLGMIKLESFQIHTVNLVKDDSVEIVAEERNGGVLDGIVASFNILLEYLD